MIATIKTFAGETSNETIELLEDTTFIKIQTEKFKKLADNNLTWSHIECINLIMPFFMKTESNYNSCQVKSATIN